MDHLAYVVAAAMLDLSSLVGVAQRCCWCVYYAMMIDHVSFLFFAVDDEEEEVVLKPR